MMIASMAMDALDNLFVVDINMSKSTTCPSQIRKITPSGEVSKIYNLTGEGISAGRGLVIDRDGNLYYGTQQSIKKLTPDGVESIYCGGSMSFPRKLEGSCGKVHTWNPTVLGFDANGGLIFFQSDSSVSPNKYVFYSVSEK